MLKFLARWSFRHRIVVLLIWLSTAAGATFAGSLGGEYADGGRLTGTDSDRAHQLLEAVDPEANDIVGSPARMVFEDPAGISSPKAAARIDGFLHRLVGIQGVIRGPTGSDDLVVANGGTIAYGDVVFDPDQPNVVDSIDDAAAELRASPTEVDFASPWFQVGGVPDSEIFGIAVAALILLIAFGSLIAMGLPILTAVFGIVIGLGAVQLWAVVVPTPDFTVQVASMVGIGVGVDYALFIVTRFRESLRRHGNAEQATIEAMGTAGRAVVFAGCTVVISLLGMLLMGMSFFQGLAFGTASAVLVAVLAAITLLPALLGLFGGRIDRRSRRRTAVRAPATSRTRPPIGMRWSLFVQRHRVAATVVGFGVLLALGAPTLAMRQGSADLGNDARGTTTRAGYDRMSVGFGPGSNGPLVIMATSAEPVSGDTEPTVGDRRLELVEIARLVDAIAATDGVAALLAVEPLDAATAMITLLPTTGPQDEATADLVHRLRDDVIPATGVTAYVGGATASDVDFADLLTARLPIFIGAVLVLSFLLLLVVFRSILVPLKAVVLNLLSIGAAYGVMVAVFQWGWLGDVFGIDGRAPIEPWAPMMLFAIVFGLSMDYEVFLLWSIRERYDHGDDNSTAVVNGLAATARVITAAAAIMVSVFGTFVFGDLRAIKLIGLGLGVAVLVDATIVRMLLVPATMELLGDRNWWLPRWLDAILPHVSIDDASPSITPRKPRETPATNPGKALEVASR